MIHYKYMEEDDHFTQTQLPTFLLPLQLLPLAAPLFLLFSTALLSTCSNFAALSRCLFMARMVPSALALLQQWWLPKSMVGVVYLLYINGNKPNNHPLCHLCGATVLLLLQHRLASCLQLFKAYHSESVSGQVYRYLPHLSITRVTKAYIFSHKRITLTRWSVISHLKSVNVCL
jgi:hypothetical protein